MIKMITLTSLLSISLLGPLLQAEEGGSGHYMPGSMASFIDGVPAEEALLFRLNYLHYEGSNAATIPHTGTQVVNMDARSDAYGLTGLYSPGWEMGGKWNYAMSATIPLVSMKVSGYTPQFPNVSVSDEVTALGDIILMPLMFDYRQDQDLSFNARLALYLPTGSYSVGELANTGKNFWTVEPTVAVTYLGHENGIEASLFWGIDFNTENEDTDYKSGSQMHLDGTLAQHFPLLDGTAGFGVTAFWYRQISDDSGDGATLGAFRAKANGGGPVLSYVSTNGKVVGELKYLNEFDNQNRLEGDTVFFKLLGKF